MRRSHLPEPAVHEQFDAWNVVPFRRPRGLRFGPNGHLYCVARDAVVAFDYDSGYCFGAVVHHPRLNGQAVEFFGIAQV
ncbi:hypothetical protein [Cupriavidus lacunae]|uniref:hypothetical protein n=1 Tax=Cupriavidus lacunae TaxID=2666307 RepID=UPI001058D77F|nr:hypothetical protein [Cupriavidus lacunae]